MMRFKASVASDRLREGHQYTDLATLCLATSFKDHALAMLEVHKEVLRPRVIMDALSVGMLSMGGEARAEHLGLAAFARTPIRSSEPEDRDSSIDPRSGSRSLMTGSQFEWNPSEIYKVRMRWEISNPRYSNDC